MMFRKSHKFKYVLAVLAAFVAVMVAGSTNAFAGTTSGSNNPQAANQPIATSPNAMQSTVSATTPLSAASLSSQPTLGTTMLTDGAGDYGTVTFSQDKAATTAMMTASGYLCGDVAYNGIVKWYTAIFGWVSWTYDVHFGAYVCNDMVRSVTHLYDTVDSIMATWSWCGTVASNWGPSLPYTSVHSYSEGCFTLFDKIAVTELPWVRITIGGNGGLWARSTGVN